MSTLVSPRAGDQPLPSQGRLRVLMAEDDRTSRHVLQHMLAAMDCDVDVAADGEEAIARFDESATDCVFLDVWMPRLNGREVCRIIKERSGDRFVPVIFVTQLSSADDLAACLEAGGDDFVSKPVDRTVLHAKLRAMQRIRALHDRLHRKRQVLARQQAALLRDQEVARDTLTRVLQPCRRENPNLRFFIRPETGFSGDLVLADWTPRGTQLLLVGDFAGRGLRAALGAVPTSQAFHRMCRHGFPSGRILRELNRLLREMLPPGLFLATALFEVDAARNRLSVWNGGLPAASLVREGEGLVASFPSAHLPIGIASDREFDATEQYTEIRPGDRLIACSDGLLERLSPSGEMFGASRLADVLNVPGPPAGLFERISRAVDGHSGGEEAADDCTLVELVCELRPAPPALPLAGRTTVENGEPWRCELNFEGSALRFFDPMPALARLLADVGGLDGHRETLLTVLTELFTNAVDHGLLRLDSTLKGDPTGFAAYYGRRQAALQALTDGRIAVAVEHQPIDGGHRMVVEVRDSGPGFDARLLEPEANVHGLHGRGIPLVRSLCRDLQIVGAGNEVRAIYEWTDSSEDLS